MAEYFLKRSATYVNQGLRSILRRREVVCDHLNNKYKVSQNENEEVFNRIAASLAEEGIKISASQFEADKRVLRTAFLWLSTQDEEEKRKLATRRNNTGLVAIHCLIKDDLLTWADFEPQREDLPEGEPEIASQPEALAATEQPPPALRLADCEAGSGVLAASAALMESLEVMLNENERLRTEVSRLSGEAEQHSQSDGEYLQFLAFLEEENISLEERLRAAKEGIKHSHSATLAEIAVQHPEFPQLTAIAQQLAVNGRGGQDQFSNLISRLPNAFAWGEDKGEMLYEKRFLRTLAGLQDGERHQIVRQLEALGNYGAEYNALHTRKYRHPLPYTPKGCQASRGSEKWRFTWVKNGAITVYWLYHKNETSIHQSEA